MKSEQVEKILLDLQSGEITLDDALEQIQNRSFADLGFAKVDTHRKDRNGFPEVIFCQGKTNDQISEIFSSLIKSNEIIIGTLATDENFQAVLQAHPDAIYHATAKIIQLGKTPTPKSDKIITVVTGGTSDIPVAEAAAVTAETMGSTVARLYDVGVAGVHRMLENKDLLLSSNVIIAVAGMEGALASVVSGLVACPVIGVPTSVGYGASFEGLSALLSMLNSCAPGVSVVNIDNGFGAGYMAAVINNQNRKKD